MLCQPFDFALQIGKESIFQFLIYLVGKRFTNLQIIITIQPYSMGIDI